MIVVLLLRILLVALTLYLTFFSLWRTFEREHLDDVPMALDRVIIAGLLSWYLSRLPSVVELLLKNAISPLSALNPLVADSSWQVGIVLFCISLYLLARQNWRDTYALLDFVVVSLCVFLSGMYIWQFASVLASLALSGSTPVWGYVIMLPIGIMYFLGFGRLLAYFERQYRAYFWYRYRRSSAQTGFVTSIFCIGAGLFGVLSNIPQLPFAALSVPMFLTIWSLFTLVGGFILLYIRSGRLKKR